MHPYLTQLLNTPPHFQRLGWHGIPLLLPDSWNLQSHRGSASQGALFFSDLHATRLELRWHPPTPLLPGLLGQLTSSLLHWHRNPHKSLQRQIASLQKKSPDSITPKKNFTLITHSSPKPSRPHGTSALLVALNKTIELFWPHTPNSTPPHLDTITQDLLHWSPLLTPYPKPTPNSPTHPGTFWSVYGAAGFVPTSMSLRSISMLPGNTRLDFASLRHSLTLASSSMADRLLQNQTLQTWATSTIELLKKHGGGTWKNDPNPLEAHCSVFQQRIPSLTPVKETRFTFLHDTQHNRILWQQES